MRLLGILIGGVLFVTVAVQGYFLARANRQISRLSEQIENLQTRADEASSIADRSYDAEHDEADFEPRPPGGRVPPPGLVPALNALAEAAEQAGGLGAVAAAGDHALPLPPILSTPEARAQLGNFVRAQLIQERQAEAEQRTQRWTSEEQERNDALANKLGLDQGTASRFSQLLSDAGQKRREVIAKARAGTLVGPEVRSAMAEIGQTTNKELQQLLGEDRFKQYEQMNNESGRGRWGRGGPGGGR